MHMMGIDEAGRGCVIGPMVLACVLVTPKGWEKLKEIGVKDSKRLSPKKRQDLAAKIVQISQVVYVESITPATIDKYCKKKALNRLEIEVMVQMVKKFQPTKVYLDALSNKADQFTTQFKILLQRANTKVIGENRADITYPVVSAASIIAKVTRDKAISQLYQIWGNFGSGYPSDPKTIQFLKQIYIKNRGFPDCVRQSWQTVQRIVASKQMNLFPEILESVSNSI